jgi:hypothetical protein
MTDAHADEVRGLPLGVTPIGPGIRVQEGEFVPVVLTVGMGRWLNVSVPFGAFTVKDGKSRFVSTVDVVGLSAVVFGIGVAALGVRTASPIARALADRIRGN